MQRLSDLRQLYSIKGILGWPDHKKKGICPIPGHVHHNYTPSFSVFYWDGVERWKCHGACPSEIDGATGDVIDLVGFMEIPGYRRFNGAMYRQAAELLTNSSMVTRMPVVPSPVSMIAQWLWEECLPPSQQTLDYAYNRGLLDEQIEKFKIGTPKGALMRDPYNIRSDNWMTIPTFHHDELMGIKLRNLTSSGLRYMSVAGSKKGLFNFNAVNMETGPVLVVKGEIAAMVLDRFGFVACAPTAGEGSYIKDVRGALALCRPIVVGDNDRNPDTADKTRMYAEKRAAFLSADLRFPPPQWKDIDAWILNNTTTAIPEISRWIGLSDVGKENANGA